MIKKNRLIPKVYRYVIKEILKPFLFTLFLLFIIILMYTSYDYLQKAATGLISKSVLLPIIFLKNLVALEVLIPLSFFLSATTVLSRMDDNGEITVLLTSGFNPKKIFKPVLMLTIALVIFSGLLSFFIRPWSYKNISILEYNTKYTFDITKINPGHFVALEDKRVIYTGGKSKSNVLENVFIQTKDEDTLEIIYAKKASIENKNRNLLFLEDGTIYMYNLVSKKETYSKFKNGYVNLSQDSEFEYKTKALSTLTLLNSKDIENLVELQWRITVPIMTLFFGLLSIALSRSSPRIKRRSQKLIIAILLYALYYNLVYIVRKWITGGLFPLYPGTFLLTGMLFVIYLFIKIKNKREYLY